jgi:hypothetical protein
MAFMLVRLQCRYGKVREFEEVMSHLVPVLERKGWRLVGAYVMSIGRLNKVYDLWEMPDANSVRSVLALAAQEPEFREWSAKLGEYLEEEELELLEEASYSPGRRGG